MIDPVAITALDENKSPAAACPDDKKALKFLAPEVVANAFLHCEKLKVDKAGCISFQGKKYEVGGKIETFYGDGDYPYVRVMKNGKKKPKKEAVRSILVMSSSYQLMKFLEKLRTNIKEVLLFGNLKLNRTGKYFRGVKPL